MDRGWWWLIKGMGKGGWCVPWIEQEYVIDAKWIHKTWLLASVTQSRAAMTMDERIYRT